MKYLIILLFAANTCVAQIDGNWKFDNYYNWPEIFNKHVEPTGYIKLDAFARLGFARSVIGFFDFCTVTLKDEHIVISNIFGWEITGRYEMGLGGNFTSIVTTHDGEVMIIKGRVISYDTIVLTSDHPTFTKYSNLLERSVVIKRLEEDNL